MAIDPQELRERAQEIESRQREQERRAQEERFEEQQREWERRQEEARRDREEQLQLRQENGQVQRWFRSLPQAHLEILANDPDSNPPESWFWSEIFLHAPGDLTKSEGIELAQQELERRQSIETSAPRERASAAAAFNLSTTELVVAIVVFVLAFGGER